MAMEDLQPQILKYFRTIDVVCVDGRMQVWDSRTRSPASDVEITAPGASVGMVKVASLAPADVAPVLAKLRQIDPMGPRRTIND